MKQVFTLKSSIVVLSTALLLSSCSKRDTVAPLSTTPAPVSYKDANISISNFKATEISGNDILVSFSVLYSKSVENIEVLSGNTPNQLCSFYKITLNADSAEPINFSVNDPNIKGSSMYYMIRYTLSNGNWNFTPVYSLRVKQ